MSANMPATSHQRLAPQPSRRESSTTDEPPARVPAGPYLLFVSMPWAQTQRPSLGIGVLVSAVRRGGFRAKALYLNLPCASALGADLYDYFADTPAAFGMAEHLFAANVFGAAALQSDEFLERGVSAMVEDSASETALARLKEIRDVLIPRLLDECATRVLAEGADVIGFSCTFNQVFPSLALAQRLRRIAPEKRLVYGGACMHGVMGETYAAKLPELIDHVFVGEADHCVVELLRNLAAGQPDAPVAGVTVRGKLAAPAEPVRNLDEVPVPDYADFFEECKRQRTLGHAVPELQSLPYESSRGCWWGQKSHCTFCGLNAEGLSYRRKSSERIVAELFELSARYGTVRLMAADNILPIEAYRDLLPRVAQLGLDFEIFYEIKANVRRDDVAALAAAGVTAVQPGVESFSTNALRLMRKGITGLQNIQMLKWMREHQIQVIYNILTGFEGETEADYENQLRLMSALRHLDPPGGASIAAVHRFAPFFKQPEAHGIVGMRPAKFYASLTPPGLLESADIAYYFERDIPEAAPCARLTPVLGAAIEAWSKSRLSLGLHLGPGYLEVSEDDGGVALRRRLSRTSSLVLVLADARVGLAELERRVTSSGVGSSVELRASLRELVKAGYLACDDGAVVSTVPFRRPHRQEHLDQWLSRWFSISPRAAAQPRRRLGVISSGCSAP